MTMAQTDLFLDSKVETITPQQAALWLEGANLHNRPLRMGRCQALAEAIKRGEWTVNGDAIRFCVNGQLLDGQHRLQAIVLACTSVQSLVVRGLPSGSITTIDTNRAARTAQDVLSLSGVAHYSTIAPGARLLAYWEKTGNPYDHQSENAPTIDEILQLARRPGMNELAGLVKQRMPWCRKFLGAGLALFAFYTFAQYREEHARAFFEKLETGVGLENGSPILLLRSRLMMVSVHESLRPMTKGALLFKAWRLYLMGANVKQLKVLFAKTTPIREHFLMERRHEGS